MDKKLHACHDKEKTNQDIKRQVYLIAETILGIAQGVEEALVNITAVRGVLNRITHKLGQQQFISDEERALLSLTEQWLQEEKIRAKPGNGQSLGQVNLSQISALGSSFLSSAQTDQTSCSHLSTPTLSKRFSAGSTQTLNEGEELDWDGNGVELTESFHSTYSGATAKTAFSKNPYDLCNLPSLLDSDGSTEGSDKQIAKSSSYQGMYEEEMEFTLEVEEGFYSDSSSHGFDDEVTDFSPQADSGVANLDSHTSTETRLSQADDDMLAIGESLKSTGSQLSLEVTSYNRDINTWDMYGTVNLEEDLFSTASSANNSNTSTPRFVRKHKTLTSSPKLEPRENHHVEKSMTRTGDEVTVCAQPTIKLTNQIIDNIAESSQIVKSRLRANSIGSSSMTPNSTPSPPTRRKMSQSSPILQPDDPKLDKARHVHEGVIPGPKHDNMDIVPNIAPKYGGESSSSSRTSSKISINTSILADGYLKSSHNDLTEDFSLPEALRRNNYTPKSRKAVFV